MDAVEDAEEVAEVGRGIVVSVPSCSARLVAGRQDVGVVEVARLPELDDISMHCTATCGQPDARIFETSESQRVGELHRLWCDPTAPALVKQIRSIRSGQREWRHQNKV